MGKSNRLPLLFLSGRLAAYLPSWKLAVEQGSASVDEIIHKISEDYYVSDKMESKIREELIDSEDQAEITALYNRDK